jgi:hypothetical protein
VVGDRWQRNLELEPSVCDEAMENRRRLNKMAKGGLHGAGLPFWTLLLVWSFRDRAAAGGQHSWSWGPNPGFARSGLLATAHPERNPVVSVQVERRLAVTMVQSHRTPSNDHFVHVFVRNVGSATVNFYSLWLTVINP